MAEAAQVVGALADVGCTPRVEPAAADRAGTGARAHRGRERPVNPVMRTCDWCGEVHPENLRKQWAAGWLYFCTDGCIQEWAEDGRRVTADTGYVTADELERTDELEDYLAQLLQSPAFARVWYRAAAAEPRPLCINGQEYARRQKKRRGRKRP